MFYELLGSLFVFLIVPTLRSFTLRFYIYIALSLFLFGNHLLGFVLGVWIADLSQSDIDLKRIILDKKYYFMPLVVLALYIAGVPNVRSEADMYYGWLRWLGTYQEQILLTLKSFAAAICVVCLLVSTNLRQFFSARPFVFLGDISFAVYLLHIPIILSFGAYLFLQFEPNLGYRPAFIVTAAASLVVTILSAYVFTKTVDRLTLRISHKIPKLIGEKR